MTVNTLLYLGYFHGIRMIKRERERERQRVRERGREREREKAQSTMKRKKARLAVYFFRNGWRAFFNFLLVLNVLSSSL